MVSTSESGGIFISYRRSDEPSFAGRLYDRLAGVFGQPDVFMGIDSIEIGLDFEKVIAKSLAQCQVMLVVIGRSWLNAVDASGRARLESPGDYVRIEIQEALQRDIRVIPILVNGAPIPIDAELPPLMRSLTRRNGIEVSHASFNADVERLIRILERILSE